MPTEPHKPIIFISYAHADEPEKPAEGEVKWLSFVTGYLRPAIKHGAVDLWIDRLMPGGADWEREIERKLRACDIFILLVSRHSLSSDYVVDKEIAIIRERQAKGEDVHFYPLVLTPTPKIALDLVRDKNLRPRDGKPFSDYSINERYRHMNGRGGRDRGDRGGDRGAKERGRGRLTRAAQPSSRASAARRIEDATESHEVAANRRTESRSKLGSRDKAARSRSRSLRGRRLRVLPLVGRAGRSDRDEDARRFAGLTSAVFRASALARVAGKYPTRANEFRAAALRRLAAARRAAAAADAPPTPPPALPTRRRRAPRTPPTPRRSRRRRRRRRRRGAPLRRRCRRPCAPPRRRRRRAAARRVGGGSTPILRRFKRSARARCADLPLWSQRRSRMGSERLGQSSGRSAQGRGLGRLDRLVRGAPARRVARRGLRTRLRQRAAGRVGQRPGGGERVDQGASAEGAGGRAAGRASRAAAGPRRAVRLWLDRLAARRGRRRRAEPAVLSALFQRGGPSAGRWRPAASAASGC